MCCNLWTGCDAGKKFDGGRRLGQGQWYGLLQQSGCTPYSTAVARTSKVSTVPVAICCLLWLVLFVYIFLLPLPAASCRFQTLWHYAKKPFWTSLLSQSCYVSLWTMLNFILFHQSAIHIQLLGIVSQIGFLWLMLVSKIYTALQSSSRQCQSLTCKSSVHACTTASRLSFVCRDCFNCMTLSVKHASTCALHKVHYCALHKVHQYCMIRWYLGRLLYLLDHCRCCRWRWMTSIRRWHTYVPELLDWVVCMSNFEVHCMSACHEQCFGYTCAMLQSSTPSHSA